MSYGSQKLYDPRLGKLMESTVVLHVPMSKVNDVILGIRELENSGKYAFVNFDIRVGRGKRNEGVVLDIAPSSLEHHIEEVKSAASELQKKFGLETYAHVVFKRLDRTEKSQSF